MTPPNDYRSPNWDVFTKTHNWRNYISEELRSMWESFTDEQKAAIATNAQEIADREDWD